jgi:hypothetical protein
MYVAFTIVVVLILALCGLAAFYGKRFKDLLRAHATFSAKLKDQYPQVSFRYAEASDENLRKLRDRYDLDSVAGKGPEIERIINLMKWVHQLTSHARNPTAPKELNALNLIDLCKAEKKKLNCWMYSIVLNEIYLSMGYTSRMIHLEPHSGEDKESHFVTSVFSRDLGKWIMMDPDMCGYLRDENGNILGVREIRRRLIADEPLIVNDDIGGFPRILGKWSYIWYLSKNVFRYSCRQSSEFGQESQKEHRVHFALLPDGFREELLTEPVVTPRGNRIVYINDESLFWQSPSSGQCQQNREAPNRTST